MKEEMKSRIMSLVHQKSIEELSVILQDNYKDFDLLLYFILTPEIPMMEILVYLNDNEELLLEYFEYAAEKNFLFSISDRLKEKYDFWYKIFSFTFKEFKIKPGSPLKYLPYGFKYKNDYELMSRVLKNHGNALFEIPHDLQFEFIMKKLEFDEDQVYFEGKKLHFYQEKDYLQKIYEKELEFLNHPKMSEFFGPYETFQYDFFSYMTSDGKNKENFLSIDLLRGKYLMEKDSIQTRDNFKIFIAPKEQKFVLIFYKKEGIESFIQGDLPVDCFLSNALFEFNNITFRRFQLNRTKFKRHYTLHFDYLKNKNIRFQYI